MKIIEDINHKQLEELVIYIGSEENKYSDRDPIESRRFGREIETSYPVINIEKIDVETGYYTVTLSSHESDHLTKDRLEAINRILYPKAYEDIS